MAQAGRRVLDQAVGKTFGGFGGEESRVRIGKGVELFTHRGEHVRVAVAEARDGRAARGVEIAAPVCVDDLDPGAGDRDRHVVICSAVQYVRH